jgi:hypothetical protein
MVRMNKGTKPAEPVRQQKSDASMINKNNRLNRDAHLEKAFS